MLVELKNTTKKLCVIGDPVLHSKSPLIQNTMIEALGLDYVYMAQPVDRGHAAEWLSAAKTAQYAGFNATMPHKVDLVPLMDYLDEDARLYRAVNTVAIRNGIAYGHNPGRGHRPEGAERSHPGGRRGGQVGVPEAGPAAGEKRLYLQPDFEPRHRPVRPGPLRGHDPRTHGQKVPGPAAA